MLCAKPSPHSVQDVEYRVQSTFPTPIDEWALREAQKAIDKGKKKKSALLLPVDKIHNLLQKELLLYKVDSTVSMFLVAVLEYISADILKLAGNYVKNTKHVEITYEDVKISMNADKALLDMFHQDDQGSGSDSCVEPQVMVSAAPRTSLTYEEVVRELIASEKTYLRELHMLIKVFREELIKLGSEPRDIELIFSNIMDIYELTYTFLGSLEDVIEIAQDQMPFIGTCFEELAEAAEFDVYIKYARDVTSPTCQETLNEVLSQPASETALKSAGRGMSLILKYYLPALLVGPIRHCFSYMEYVRLLHGLSTADDDRESLAQVEGLLKPLQIELGRCVPPSAMPRGSAAPVPQLRARRQAALEKIHELEKLVENWDNKDLGQCCNEFIREDILLKVSRPNKLADRRVFLFDGLMILCKPNSRRQSSKERFFIRKVEIVDHQDTNELKHAFEIAPRHPQTPVILCAKTAEEKNSWMADLVMLNNRSMLERILDSILSDIERKHPLKLPPPELYKFAEPDSKSNIILEQRENGGVPLIKGATLYKLIERLTYHIYADPKFVRTFLTTYRSFCSPEELLDLLIERFNIPEPSKVYGTNDSVGGEIDKTHKTNQREDWKKYRKEYCQPIQFRVLNVLRHWVDHHFYDFERDPALLQKLEKFLESVTEKSMKKWVDSVAKIVQRKMENDNQRHITFAFAENPPPIEWHIACAEEDFSILTLHPVEIARQLTVLEFDLYRMIKPSELVGTVWTKEDKEKTSPNLMRMIKHTTNFTYWLQKNIIEAENFEERVAIYNRIIEIMIALTEMNNFNGVLAIVSAAGSASVYRLKLTYQALPQQKQKALEECREDNHFKKYREKLRSINPPCVPFVGMYMTHIVHIEENLDYLPNTQLINFFKRRKIAEITGEIEQYQNQPYIYTVEPNIRHFLENLNSFGDMSEKDIDNYLYNKSLEIEPRNCKTIPRFPRKWPHLNLKSPGIKSKAPSTKQLVNSASAIGATTIQCRAPSSNIATSNDAAKNDASTTDSKSEESSRSDNDFSVFASVQLGTGQNSPTTSSPVSPAGPGSWRSSMHIRSPSTSSTCTFTSCRNANLSMNPIPVAPRTNLQSSSINPNSPGPRSPTSLVGFEPASPRLAPCTPPPIPPRKRRDSPEISSPQQLMQHPDAPLLPPRESSPPPLPPRNSGLSPSSHTIHHLGHMLQAASLNPHTSQLHKRRHSAQVHPHRIPPPSTTTNCGTGATQPPSISPRFASNGSPQGQVTPSLPPRPAVRSAGLTSGSMFQYPTNT